MNKRINKHSYWALALAVLIIALVAVGAYVWNFRKLPISADTGKWADFATYLSGTVGVAAVVATLMAFVITLRQQQALIDSQDKMLAKQKKQIKITKKQLRNEKVSREVEFAYQASLNIFPVLLKSAEKRLLKGDVNFYDADSGSFRLFMNPLEYDNGDFIDNGSDFYFCNAFRVQRLQLNINYFDDFRRCFFACVHDFDYSVAGFFNMELISISSGLRLARKSFG